MFCWFQEIFRHDICDELWRRIQQLGVPLYLQKDVKAIYTTTYAEVQLNGDTHGEEMSNIVAKQGCPLFPTLFNLYDDELETYLDEINGNSLCSFDIVVVILLYADDVVQLSKLGANLPIFLIKLYAFCTSFSLDINLSKTKIMIFGHNKSKSKQEAFYLGMDQIQITHEYEYLGIDFYAHGYSEPSSKKQRIANMKAWIATLMEEKKQ